MPFRQGVELWEGLVDMGVATALASASDVTSPPPPPGHHLLLPADAHADSSAARALSDALREQ